MKEAVARGSRGRLPGLLQYVSGSCPTGVKHNKAHENSGKFLPQSGQNHQILVFNPEIAPEFSVISISSIEF
jgi:hypothetical protein